MKNKIAPHIIQIIYQLQNAGYETYLVGGAVRDILLNKEPKDYDVSTDATPVQIRDVFGRRRARIIGRRFKIVHLYHGKDIIEISTFRAAPKPVQGNQDESNNSNIVLRDNEYGTSYDDAYRRDFTVNAVFYNPSENNIIDYTNSGINDINAGLVRIIGNPYARFSEDPVRILRALKLVGQYNFTLTDKTKKALNESLEQITLCSKSRLMLELEKILRSPYSDKILQAFYEYGFLNYFLPNTAENWGNKSVQTAIRLLSLHCKRLQEENCPDYLSTVVALIVIPFIYKNIEESDIPNYYPGIEKDIKKMIFHIFYPYNFPKYIITATIDAIVLQQRIYKKI